MLKYLNFAFLGIFYIVAYVVSTCNYVIYLQCVKLSFYSDFFLIAKIRILKK